MQRLVSLLVFVCMVLLFPAQASADFTTIYFSDLNQNKLRRIDPDGSNLTDIVTGIDIRGPYVDTVDDYIYFYDSTNSQIKRTDLSGTGVTVLVGDAGVTKIIVNQPTAKLYYSEQPSDDVYVGNVDGTGFASLLSATGDATNIDIDFVNEKIYLISFSSSNIQRYNLDGTGAETLVTGLSSPRDIAVDTVNEKIYWTEQGTGKIRRSDLDGSNVEDVLTSGVSEGWGIDVDEINSKVYFIDRGDDEVKRMNLDGSNLETVTSVGGTNGTDIYVAFTDTTPPTVSSFSPTDGSSTLATNGNLQITFNETIGKTGTGTVSIYKGSDDSLVEQIAVTGSLITGSGTTIMTINPTDDLEDSTAYYVQISQNAFPNLAELSYVGISDKTTWNFTTADETSPTVSLLSPLDEATGVGISDNLQITFNEAIGTTGTGTLSIYKASDDSLVEQIAVISSLVTGSGTTTMTINPTDDLSYATEYYIQVSSLAFPDTSGNFYTGISNETTWNFTTESTPVTPSTPSSQQVQTTSTQSAGKRPASIERMINDALYGRLNVGMSSIGGSVDTENPAISLLLGVQERLQDRIEERIQMYPYLRELLEGVLRRLNQRIVERILVISEGF